MRLRSARVSLLAVAAMAAAGSGMASAGTDDAAHALADKFARGAQPAKPAKPAAMRSRKEPAPAAVANSEAERRRAEQLRAEQLKADEQEMLARARAEAEAARAETEKAQRETFSAQREAAGIADAKSAPEPADIGAAPAETTEALEARRQAESDAVAARLRRTREALAAAKAAAARAAETHAEGSQAEGPPQSDLAASTREPERSPPATAAAATRLAAPAERRVTVLMVIDHGSKGIRRFDATGDPILCLDDDCFVGAGADKPAARLPRNRALGVGNTFGKRAGACSHSLSCVLRDVDLGGYPQVLRPIDLRVVHHDRRDPVQVKGDSDCTLRSGELTCRFAVRGRDWRAWIVPEPLAASAGPALLQSALEDGLGATRTVAIRRP